MKHRIPQPLIPLLMFLLLFARSHSQQMAITGGTLIDLSQFGKGSKDIVASTVLIKDGMIVAVGPANVVKIPEGTTRVDASGAFIVPGLIDGYGAIRNQSFAAAYLYDGVTSVYVPTVQPLGGGDGERKIFRDARPGPHLLLGAPMTGYSEVGDDPSDKPMKGHRLQDKRLTNEQLQTRVDRLALQGFRGLEVSYDVWPDQVDVIIAAAKARSLPVIAEPAFTPYPYVIDAGVNALLRNDHYLVAVAPAVTQLARADDLRAGTAAQRVICSIDPETSAVEEFGKQLASSNTAIMPALAMEASADGLDLTNPWKALSARILKAEDLDNPPGFESNPTPFLDTQPDWRRRFFQDCAWHREVLDAQLYRLGAKFLAGSSAPGYGVMPGSGLHRELMLLHRIGLSPREALAAATSNFAEIYGWKDIGIVEPGRIGDILVLGKDPRVDAAAIDSIRVVIFKGAVLDREQLLTATPN